MPKVASPSRKQTEQRGFGKRREFGEADEIDVCDLPRPMRARDSMAFEWRTESAVAAMQVRLRRWAGQKQVQVQHLWHAINAKPERLLLGPLAAC